MLGVCLLVEKNMQPGLLVKKIVGTIEKNPSLLIIFVSLMHLCINISCYYYDWPSYGYYGVIPNTIASTVPNYMNFTQIIDSL